MKAHNSKIKVMFIIDFIFAATGGTENQVVRLLTNLDEKKFDLYLLCLHETRWITHNQTGLKSRVKTFNYNVFNHKDPRNIISFLHITKYIKEVKPDVVITFFKTSYILGVLAARLAGVAHILTTRRDYGLWLDRRVIQILRFADRFVEGIITNSYNVKELTVREERYHPSGIHVIYNGIDIRKFQDRPKNHTFKDSLGIPSDNRVVGIVAGLRPMKRHKTLLNAAQQVLEKRGDVHFIIIGDGPLRKDLEIFAAELNIDKHLLFTGWVEDIVPFLSIFDIGVNSSANEGLSNAIMEYMAYGVPCIVSRAGGNPELIEHRVNGYTFELDNHSELAGHILSLLQDTEKQTEFVSKSKEIICTKFGLERMISDYENYFIQVIRDGN